MIQTWQVLASLGIALCLAEFFTPSFFALPAGLAFLATSAFALAIDDWRIVAVILAGNLALVYATFQRFIWPRLQTTTTRSNADGMAGKVAVVIETIDPSMGQGEVKLYGDNWKVIASQSFAVGEKVRIVRTEGNRVVVVGVRDDIDPL